ncbi:MAG: polysaccharide pyruvyl transferase family protein, partial [Pyrinomonadaceae bacterium]
MMIVMTSNPFAAGINTSTSIAGATPFHGVENDLAPYKGKPVFFDPLYGNNGDKLIEMGSRLTLERAGVKMVSNPSQAALIVLSGGASMTDIWEHGFKTLAKYNKSFPHIPLIVLPASYSFKKTDFAAMFRDRKAEAKLFTREHYSLERLKSLRFPSEVQVNIDHDMAFRLHGSSFIKRLQASVSSKHILIVERADREAMTAANDQLLPNGFHVPRVLVGVTTPLKRLIMSSALIRRKKSETPFAIKACERLFSDLPSLQKIPVHAADISNSRICSFHRFSALIASSAAVVTTRLHVGILAAMLDKPVYLATGPYNKILGI